MKLEHLREQARQAHSGTSFSPERRADTFVKGYSQELESDLKELGKNSGNYEKKYIEKLATYLSRKSRTMSPMITGGSNFPVARNRKAIDSEMKAWHDFNNWRERYFKAVNRVPTPSPEEDLDDAVADLDKLIINQQMMKDANKILRSKSKTKTCELLDAGFGLKSVTALMIDQKSFPAYALTNNNAKIKARKDKILTMKARILVKENFEKIEFEGGYIDIDNDRVIIKHYEKPEQAVIDKIKRCGFGWSRNYGCWCRKHTAMALRDAKDVIL